MTMLTTSMFLKQNTTYVIFISLTYTQDDDKENLLMMVLVMVMLVMIKTKTPQCSHQEIMWHNSPLMEHVKFSTFAVLLWNTTILWYSAIWHSGVSGGLPACPPLNRVERDTLDRLHTGHFCSQGGPLLPGKIGITKVLIWTGGQCHRWKSLCTRPVL